MFILGAPLAGALLLAQVVLTRDQRNATLLDAARHGDDPRFRGLVRDWHPTQA